MKIRIVLFNIDWRQLSQAVIGLFTFSKISHVGILFQGTYIVYDAHESRGNVDYNQHIRKWGKRKITVYEVDDVNDIGKRYALGKRYCKYDYKSWLGWIPFIVTNDPEDVNCFELGLQTLLSMPKINGFDTKEIAGDIRQKLFAKRIDSDDIFVLMERAQLNPVYHGLAESYF